MPSCFCWVDGRPSIRWKVSFWHFGSNFLWSRILRFINTDYALAHALRQRQNLDDIDNKFITTCDQLVSYDVSCSYWINIVKRFRISFPDLVPAVERIRWLIPLVHVRNHKDNCMYNYASSYVVNAGHFHGETAEHYWPECNQLGGQIRQMNNGHRQETLIDHHSDWNWKKTMNMCACQC